LSTESTENTDFALSITAFSRARAHSAKNFKWLDMKNRKREISAISAISVFSAGRHCPRRPASLLSPPRKNPAAAADLQSELPGSGIGQFRPEIAGREPS
jgi:hypothetical protein